jgi:hypothetical protein
MATEAIMAAMSGMVDITLIEDTQATAGTIIAITMETQGRSSADWLPARSSAAFWHRSRILRTRTYSTAQTDIDPIAHPTTRSNQTTDRVFSADNIVIARGSTGAPHTFRFVHSKLACSPTGALSR